jgi:hypothetical protein
LKEREEEGRGGEERRGKKENQQRTLLYSTFEIEKTRSV